MLLSQILLSIVHCLLEGQPGGLTTPLNLLPMYPMIEASHLTFVQAYNG